MSEREHLEGLVGAVAREVELPAPPCVVKPRRCCFCGCEFGRAEFLCGHCAKSPDGYHHEHADTCVSSSGAGIQPDGKGDK